MRAYIVALLAASVIADDEDTLGKPKSAGGYDYRKGGSDWATKYNIPITDENGVQVTVTDDNGNKIP